LETRNQRGVKSFITSYENGRRVNLYRAVNKK
jgi:hypothetical protein